MLGLDANCGVDVVVVRVRTKNDFSIEFFFGCGFQAQGIVPVSRGNATAFTPRLMGHGKGPASTADARTDYLLFGLLSS